MCVGGRVYVTPLLSIRSPGGCISHQAFTQPFVSLNQSSCLIHQAPFSSVVSSVPLNLEKNLKSGGKGTVGPSRSGCNASNFLLSRSLNVCALSLPPRRGINSLLHLCVPPPSRSLIHLISALRRGFGPCLPTESPPPLPRSWLAHSLACLLAGWLAAPYSGDVASPGAIVPVAGRSIGRNCVAATVELRRGGGTNWILAQSM